MENGLVRPQYGQYRVCASEFVASVARSFPRTGSRKATWVPKDDKLLVGKVFSLGVLSDMLQALYMLRGRPCS